MTAYVQYMLHLAVQSDFYVSVLSCSQILAIKAASVIPARHLMANKVSNLVGEHSGACSTQRARNIVQRSIQYITLVS